MSNNLTDKFDRLFSDFKRYSIHDLEDADFRIDVDNVEITSFRYNGGDVEDIEYEVSDKYVHSVDSYPLSNYYYIDADAFNDFMANVREVLEEHKAEDPYIEVREELNEMKMRIQELIDSLPKHPQPNDLVEQLIKEAS